MTTFDVSANDFTPGMTAESGTKQSLRVMSAFWTQRSAVLFSIFAVKCPGEPWQLHGGAQLMCRREEECRGRSGGEDAV